MKIDRLMWCVLVHLGRNFGGDNPFFAQMDFDEAMWREATERMKSGGVNTLILDLSEGVVYPSHPELAIKGSWSADKLKGELAWKFFRQETGHSPTEWRKSVAKN